MIRVCQRQCRAKKPCRYACRCRITGEITPLIRWHNFNSDPESTWRGYLYHNPGIAKLISLRWLRLQVIAIICRKWVNIHSFIKNLHQNFIGGCFSDPVRGICATPLCIIHFRIHAAVNMRLLRILPNSLRRSLRVACLYARFISFLSRINTDLRISALSSA